MFCEKNCFIIHKKILCIDEKITNNREYFFSTIAIPLQKNKKIDKYEAEKNIWDNIDIVLFRKYLFAKD